MKLKALTAGALGAGLMYILDPQRGHARRARIVDKTLHLKREVGRVSGVTARDIRNRTRGAVAELKSTFQFEEISDEVLVARVRSRIGRVTSHPRVIVVSAADGAVTISGPVLESEAAKLRTAVGRVHGVRQVVDLLEIHPTADIPQLGGVQSSDGADAARASWSPAARLLVGTAGGALALYGARRRGVAGTAAGSVGLSLVAGAIAGKRVIGGDGHGEMMEGAEASVETCD